MRLFLLYHGRYPSEKAASLFAAKNAEAFAEMGARVTLVVPRRLLRIRRDPQEFFGLRSNIPTVYLPTIDLYTVPIVGRWAHIVSYIVFSTALFVYLLIHARRDDWVYSNESLPLLVTSYFFSHICYEVHDFPEKNLWLYRILFSRTRYIVATNQWKANALQEKFGVLRKKIIVEPNAVDFSPYENAPSREEARMRLDLSVEKRIAVYTGHLYSWKGVDTLAEAATLMPEVQIYIVGGTEYDLVRYRERYSAPNLHFVGHRSHDEMSLWQTAANVLVLPNTAKEEVSARYTSPMKLFEYMASGTPIVASRLPSIQEIVGSERAILVEPDNASALAEGIQNAVRGDSRRRAQSAREWAENHTWHKRASRLTDFLRCA